MRESEYQAELIEKINRRFPKCVILHNDSGYQQGIPDLTILYMDKWAMLEVKMSPKSALQPNQEYFVHQLDEMSFAAIIYPQNEEDVLDALQEAFQPLRRSRISKS